jgi:hypothetical protein
MTDQRIKDAEALEGTAKEVASRMREARRQIFDLAEDKADLESKAQRLRDQVQFEQNAVRFAAEAKAQSERFAREEQQQRERHAREWELAQQRGTNRGRL